MSYSINTFTVTGGQADYDLSFAGEAPGYIDQSHVIYFIGSVEQPLSARTFNTATNVTINPVPADGTLISFRRITSPTTALVNWVAGEPITEELLDLSNKQMLYLAQESADAGEINISIVEPFTQLAQAWAENPEDDPVIDEPASYSAFHHRKKSEEAATEAISKAAAASTSEGNALASANNASASEGNALTSANNALASETAASISEENALDSANSASTSGWYASTSADNASTSEGNALTSANNASASEGNALASANNASTSEGNALTSANNASASEGNALTSANNALASEENALASANSASTSDENALASANSASTSEGNASDSADAASTSEGNALTSANNALASETAASTSEGNALTSANNALASETAASTSEGNAATSADNALASETAASSYAGTSADNKELAEAWAQSPEDVPVVAGGTDYSALHHSAKAAQSATDAYTYLQSLEGINATDVNANTAHRGTVSGNPHQVTAGDVNCLALDNTTAFTPTGDYHPATKKYADENSPGTDLFLGVTSDVVAVGSSTGDNVTIYGATSELAGVMTSTDKVSLDANTAHRGTTTGNPHGVTAADIGAANILTALKTVDGTGSGLDADKLQGATLAQLNPAVSEKGSRSTTGTWTLYGLVINRPLYLIAEANSSNATAWEFYVTSGTSNGGKTGGSAHKWMLSSHSDVDHMTTSSAVLIPSATTVVIENPILIDATIRAYQG